MNAAAGDAAVLDRWWRHFVATGALPPELPLVQRRLVRAVHRGELPSGPAHVKVMTFPRAKDRLRYLLRALPAEHEANMLRRVAAAGIPCPAVLAVRTARRAGLPHRSLLVLRTLALAPDGDEAPARRLSDEAGLTQRLLAAGVVHHDLHGGNFLRLASGELAVIDLQSASAAGARAAASGVRIAAAARLARERPGLGDDTALAIVRDAGLLHDDAEVARAALRIAKERAHYRRSRVLRCFAESTEFTRRVRWNGIEHALRGERPAGRWRAHPVARDAWLGQRILQLDGERAPLFAAYFHKWWWLGGSGALYVPAACRDEDLDAEARFAAAAAARGETLTAIPDDRNRC